MSVLKAILERARYLTFIAVVCLLVAAIGAFGWGAAKTVTAIVKLVTSAGQDPLTGVALVRIVDAFLIAAGLLVFALGLYELFIGGLDLPAWLVMRDLHDLKTRLASVIILVMAVGFLEHLVADEAARDVFWRGLSVAVVSAALIAFTRLSAHD